VVCTARSPSTAAVWDKHARLAPLRHPRARTDTETAIPIPVNATASLVERQLIRPSRSLTQLRGARAPIPPPAHILRFATRALDRRVSARAGTTYPVGMTDANRAVIDVQTVIGDAELCCSSNPTRIHSRSFRSSQGYSAERDEATAAHSLGLPSALQRFPLELTVARFGSQRGESRIGLAFAKDLVTAADILDQLNWVEL
jgi:hypothetical protein